MVSRHIEKHLLYFFSSSKFGDFKVNEEINSDARALSAGSIYHIYQGYAKHLKMSANLNLHSFFCAKSNKEE